MKKSWRGAWSRWGPARTTQRSATRSTTGFLRRFARKIAADERRHYTLFYDHLKCFLEGFGPWKRLAVGRGRIFETNEDKLAYAFHAANMDGKPYDQKSADSEYRRRT